MSNNEKLSESIENGKVCCLINVEEIKYIYLIKKSILSNVDYDLWQNIWAILCNNIHDASRIYLMQFISLQL